MTSFVQQSILPVFPLYDELAKKIPEKILDPGQVSSIIRSLNNDHANVIFAIILHHYFLENYRSGFDLNYIVQNLLASINKKGRKRNFLPYNTEILVGGKGTVTIYQDLPQALQYIIINYLHIILSQTQSLKVSQ